MRCIALAVYYLLTGVWAKAAEVGVIQGAAHASPVVGERVEAEGVVTLLRGNGFFLQGAPDGEDATSDGVFVFSSAPPEVMLGDRVRVEGGVIEFTPTNRPRQLSLTEIAEPEIVVLAGIAALPTPVVLGPDGQGPPLHPSDASRRGPATSSRPSGCGKEGPDGHAGPHSTGASLAATETLPSQHVREFSPSAVHRESDTVRM